MQYRCGFQRCVTKFSVLNVNNHFPANMINMFNPFIVDLTDFFQCVENPLQYFGKKFNVVNSAPNA